MTSKKRERLEDFSIHFFDATGSRRDGAKGTDSKCMKEMGPMWNSAQVKYNENGLLSRKE